MKAFSRIFLVCFLAGGLVSCQPLESEDSGGRRDRGRGETDFDPGDIDDINLDEIKNIDKKELLKNCHNYNCTSSINFSLFGDASPARAAQNCMCKVMDEGLKPLCKKEKQLEKLADRRRGDDDAMEEIEIMQEELEIMKDDISDVFYSMADTSDDFHADIDDEIDEMYDDADSTLEKLIANGLGLVAKDQFGSTTRFAERRGRNICLGNFFSNEDEEEDR